MIAIVDYGVGNLFSLTCSFRAIGAEAKLTSDRAEIEAADKIVLPGVGAFGDAAKKLFSSGLAEVVIAEAKKGKPILGICLGMQLLFDKSYEYGCHNGLGLIKGEIRPITDVIPAGYKVPHIGWNALTFPKKNELFQYLVEGSYVYFVHSYYAEIVPETVGVSEYAGVEFTAMVKRGGLWACQFHPEKSGRVGLALLKEWLAC